MVKDIWQSDKNKPWSGSLVYVKCKAGREDNQTEVIATNVSKRAMFKDSPSKERSFPI